MVMTNAVRLSCWAAVVGAAISIIAILIFSITVPGHALDSKMAQSAGFIGINVAGAAGMTLVVYGLPGVFARWREGWGGLGLAGIALIALAEMIFGFVSLMAATLYSWLGVMAPDIFKDPNGPPLVSVVLLVWLVAIIAGNILMAIPILRRRVGPRWVAFLLIGSAVMSIVYIAAALTQPNVLVSLVGSLGPILLAVAVGYLGYLGASDTRTGRAERAASAA
ncbi:MAG TPA: hypothetical protein VGU71_09440 [Candidatus Dormibacteraeota bacterium]|nr:hypothetical protein [Candidatus Dormibacteraeota bacterium]